MPDEVGRQQRDIVSALAQRGHDNGKHAEPVIEVLTKLPAFGFLAQVPVGRRDHPDIDAARRILANALELTIL